MKKNIALEFPLLAIAPRKLGDEPDRRARVLIAEDDYAFRDLLTLAFEDDGYEVVAVADGYDLLATLGSSLLTGSTAKPFDLVISDVRMPRWSGIDTLEKLSHSPLVPPVIVITAFGSEEIHQRAAQAGAVAVLDKPFDIEDVVDLSRRLLIQKVARAEKGAVASQHAQEA